MSFIKHISLVAAFGSSSSATQISKVAQIELIVIHTASRYCIPITHYGCNIKVPQKKFYWHYIKFACETPTQMYSMFSMLFK